jgi:NitT/TauT family transport system substrate-binding protein
MQKAGADPSRVRFAVLGPNIYDAVRLGQVDAAWVGEPALSQLVKQGGRALVNLMHSDDAAKFLGGRFEGMGVSVRAPEIAARRDEMLALTRALEKGLQRLQRVPATAITAALPRQLVAGMDTARLTEIFGHYRASLYPLRGTIDAAACERVVEMLKFDHMIKPEFKAEQVLDLSIAGG